MFLHNNIFRNIYYLFFLLLSNQFLFAQIDEENRFEYFYKKATTATFYSANFLNGFHEINLAKKYIDSAYTELDKFSDNDDFFDQNKFKLDRLNNEINLSSEIAIDNLNFNIPHYSLFSNYRPDYEIVEDDPVEILIENLILKQLEQQDPISRGSLIGNTAYILLNINPFDENYILVGLDFLSTTTDHYGIRPHEIAKILGNDGFIRYTNNSLTSSDWEKILNHFNAEHLYNFQISELGTIEDKMIYYKGISLYKVDNKTFVPEKVRDHENFITGKKSSYKNSILISTLFYLIFFLSLFFLFQKIKFLKSEFSSEVIFSNSLILLSNIFSALISIYLLRLFIPDINAFMNALTTKIWISSKILIPVLVCSSITFLTHFKFSSLPTSSDKIINKIIFSSITSSILLNIFFISHSKIDIDYSHELVSLIVFFGAFIPSLSIGKFFHSIFKNSKLKWHTSIFSVFNIILAIIVLILLDLNSENVLFYLFVSNLIAAINIILINYKKTYKIQDQNNNLNSYVNPFQYILGGVNIEEVQNKLELFLNDDNDILFQLKGESNIGKTRFIKEFINSNKSNYEFFYGDFDEFKEGQITMYEPFFQAFCQPRDWVVGEDNYIFPETFFNDRSQTFNNIKKATELASNFSPIDIGQIVSIENNDGMSINEISSELIEILEKKCNSKIILFLDDYQFVDSATNELLIDLLKKIKKRTTRASKFKIVISLSRDGTYSKNEDFEQCFKELNSITLNRVSEAEINAFDGGQFLEKLFDNDGFKYFDNQNIYFSKNFRDHLKYEIKELNETFNPGNLLYYIQALKNNDFLNFDGTVIKLSKTPDESFSFLDSKDELMKSKFQALNDEEKKILESAAHVGFKFDASIISHIWKLDLIHILSTLEKIEDYGLIEDDIENDNIYSFINKNFHRWLRSNHKKQNSSDHNQKVIEFQKRIIDSVTIKGETFINNLEIDILKSITDRCNLFLKIDEIKVHALKFNIITSKKLAFQNKIRMSINYLLKIETLLDYLDKNHSIYIVQILERIIELDESLLKIDYEGIYDSNKFYERLFDKLFLCSEKPYKSKVALLYLRDMAYSSKIKEKSLDDQQKIRSRELKFNDYRLSIGNEDSLRIDFYMSILHDKLSKLLLYSLKKSAKSRSNILLYKEITLELCDLHKKNKEYKDFLNQINECIILEKDEDFSLIKTSSLKSFADIMNTINSILLNNSISFNKAKVLIRLILNYCEFYLYKKEFENIISLCNLNESLCLNIGSKKSLHSTWNYLGVSLIKLNDMDKASKVFKKYFDSLIINGNDKEDFIQPIEGIIKCCQLKNDFKLYYEVKEILYENLKYISSGMISQNLNSDLFGKDQSLKDFINIIPKRKKIKSTVQKINTTDLSINVFKILFLISLSDGHVDDSEIYDLEQSVSAINHSLGLKNEFSTEKNKKVLSKLNKIKLDEIGAEFEKICKKLKIDNEKNTLKCIYNFCYDISMADGIIVEAEQKLLDIAKRHFINEIL